MSLWEYIRTEVDNEIAEAHIGEALALQRICMEKWKMDSDEFVRFVLFRRSRMRLCRAHRRKHPHIWKRGPERFLQLPLL